MYYIANLMNHLKSVQRCMDNMRGSAILNAKDLVILVGVGNRSVHMQPQFTYSSGGRIRYTLRFEQHVGGFIGWRPYFTKRWELSTEKLKFKAYACACGVRTPPYWANPDDAPSDVVIKKNRSSFGVGMRGPFRDVDVMRSDHDLQADEYYEAFIAGRIAKAWYWDGALTALELRDPPAVTGDGSRSIAQLAREQCSRDIDAAALAWIAEYHGYTVTTVLPKGERMLVDFKYGSPYDTPSRENENVLSSCRGSSIKAQFVAAGGKLFEGIPEPIRQNTVFTLDAVVDDAGRAWFLEMNSNPMVHPDVYPAMLQSLLGAATPEQEFCTPAQA